MSTFAPPATGLKVLCLEDNPLIAFHLEQIIEDLGHDFIGTIDSFSEAKERFDSLSVDCVLIDIDLADGRTGLEAAAWLVERGTPALFVTGQEALAHEHRELVLGTVKKPITAAAIEQGLNRIVLHRLG